MKTTEEYFQEFYNEVRYQIEQGAKANFTRANKIWAKYEASKSAQSEEITTLRTQLAEAREALEYLSQKDNYLTIQTGIITGGGHSSDFAKYALEKIDEVKSA